jgi:hypothetical protein
MRALAQVLPPGSPPVVSGHSPLPGTATHDRRAPAVRYPRSPPTVLLIRADRDCLSRVARER